MTEQIDSAIRERSYLFFDDGGKRSGAQKRKNISIIPDRKMVQKLGVGKGNVPILSAGYRRIHLGHKEAEFRAGSRQNIEEIFGESSDAVLKRADHVLFVCRKHLLTRSMHVHIMLSRLGRLLVRPQL